MWEALWWVIKLYIPPKPGDDLHLARYHMAQSVGIVSIWILAWIAGLWLIGKLPFIPQIAWADDVRSVSVKVDGVVKENSHITRKLDMIQLLQIRTNISEQFKDACLAQRTGNQTDLDTANAQLSTLTETFYQMAGHSYALPTSCSTVLVSTKP